MSIAEVCTLEKVNVTVYAALLPFITVSLALGPWSPPPLAFALGPVPAPLKGAPPLQPQLLGCWQAMSVAPAAATDIMICKAV